MNYLIKERDLEPNLRIKIASGSMSGIDDLLKNKITLSDLNSILKDYFNKTKDKVSKGLLDSELQGYLNDFLDLLQKFRDGIEYEDLGSVLKARIKELEDAIKDLQTFTSNSDIDITDINRRLTNLENNFNATKIDHGTRITNLENNLNTAITNIDNRITNLTKTINKVINNIGDVDISNLLNRVKKIETTINSWTDGEPPILNQLKYSLVDNSEVKKLFKKDIYIDGSVDDTFKFADVFVTVPNSRVKELFEKNLVIDTTTNKVLIT